MDHSNERTMQAIEKTIDIVCNYIEKLASEEDTIILQAGAIAKNTTALAELLKASAECGFTFHPKNKVFHKPTE